jgi:hypothetical protein
VAEKSDREHTYKYLPNNDLWTWEMQSQTGEVTDVNEILTRLNTQANARLHSMEEPPYNRWQTAGGGTPTTTKGETVKIHY